MVADYTTEREIREQPLALDAVLEELRANEPALTNAVSPSSTFCLTGCGTSYYLALSGNALLNGPATSTAVPGSEVLISPEQLPDDGVDFIVPVSRSGESTETVRATETLQDRYPDADVLAVTCTEGSTLFEVADVPLLSPKGSEDSMAMTKSYASMLLVFEYVTRLLRDPESASGAHRGIRETSADVIERADDVARELGSRTDVERFMFLGTGEFFGVAAEAMLKLEEMSLSWTKAYHTLEFRHGPRSIVDEDTLVTLFLPDRRRQLHADLAADVSELGATTLAVGRRPMLDAVDADFEVEIPGRPTPGLPLYAPVFQLLGYYRAVETGLDPDEPRNLSQVVKF